MFKKWLVKWEFECDGKWSHGQDDYGVLVMAWLRVLRLMLDRDVWNIQIERRY